MGTEWHKSHKTTAASPCFLFIIAQFPGIEKSFFHNSVPVRHPALPYRKRYSHHVYTMLHSSLYFWQNVKNKGFLSDRMPIDFCSRLLYNQNIETFVLHSFWGGVHLLAVFAGAFPSRKRSVFHHAAAYAEPGRTYLPGDAAVIIGGIRQWLVLLFPAICTTARALWRP